MAPAAGGDGLRAAEFAVLDALRAPIGQRRRLVVVPVGRLDARATSPLEYAWCISATERRALHVAADERELWELGDAWMGGGDSLALHTVENNGGVAATIARLVEFELAGGCQRCMFVKVLR